MQNDLAVLVTAEQGAEALLSEHGQDPCLAVIIKPFTFAQLREKLTELGVRCQQHH